MAGERGEEIAAAIPFSNKHTWSWITRTYLFDQFIDEQIQKGVDMVVNLAAGLDARPYRMQLPAALKWVEIDLPEVIAYKEEILAGQKPRCSLERVPLDLSRVDARRELFDRLGRQATKVLVLTEGLIIYFTAAEVATFASDLAAPASFTHWVTDLASSGLVKMLQKKMGPKLSEGNAKLQFGSDEGPNCFRPFGWTPVEARSMLHTAAKLHRLPFFLRLVSRFTKSDGPQGSRPWSAVCLLTKEAANRP